jgi:hypothetical protein
MLLTAVDSPDARHAIVSALDGRPFGTSGPGWIARVFGVHEDDKGLWIQIGCDDVPGADLVLRMPRQASLDDAISALERCSPSLDSWPRLVEVTRRIDHVVRTLPPKAPMAKARHSASGEGAS